MVVRAIKCLTYELVKHLPLLECYFHRSGRRRELEDLTDFVILLLGRLKLFQKILPRLHVL